MTEERFQVLREWPDDPPDGVWVDASRVDGERVRIGCFRRRCVPLKDGSGANDVLFADEFFPRPARSAAFLIRVSA